MPEHIVDKINGLELKHLMKCYRLLCIDQGVRNIFDLGTDEIASLSGVEIPAEQSDEYEAIMLQSCEDDRGLYDDIITGPPLHRAMVNVNPVNKHQDQQPTWLHQES